VFIFLLALLAVVSAFTLHIGALSPIAGGVGVALCILLYSYYYPRLRGTVRELQFSVASNVIIILVIGIPILALAGQTDKMLLTWLLALIIACLAVMESYLLSARFLLPRRTQRQ
jgi:hypothetical protein